MEDTAAGVHGAPTRVTLARMSLTHIGLGLSAAAAIAAGGTSFARQLRGASRSVEESDTHHEGSAPDSSLGSASKTTNYISSLSVRLKEDVAKSFKDKAVDIVVEIVYGKDQFRILKRADANIQGPLVFQHKLCPWFTLFGPFEITPKKQMYVTLKYSLQNNNPKHFFGKCTPFNLDSYEQSTELSRGLFPNGIIPMSTVLYDKSGETNLGVVLIQFQFGALKACVRLPILKLPTRHTVPPYESEYSNDVSDELQTWLDKVDAVFVTGERSSLVFKSYGELLDDYDALIWDGCIPSSSVDPFVDIIRNSLERNSHQIGIVLRSMHHREGHYKDNLHAAMANVKKRIIILWLEDAGDATRNLILPMRSTELPLNLPLVSRDKQESILAAANVCHSGLEKLQVDNVICLDGGDTSFWECLHMPTSYVWNIYLLSMYADKSPFLKFANNIEEYDASLECNDFIFFVFANAQSYPVVHFLVSRVE